MANHRIQPETAAYIAFGIAIAALFVSTFLALSIDRIVDASVKDAVIVTKVRISELDASVRLSDARSSFSKTKDFKKLSATVSDISTDLSAAYANANQGEQNRWLTYKAALDGIVSKADAQDLSVLADLDAAVTALKSEQVTG